MLLPDNVVGTQQGWGETRVAGGGDMWPDGHREPVPGLPPEWGEIVIPDDAAELADEIEAFRRERAMAEPGATRTPPSATRAGLIGTLRPVALIMAAAVLTMMISLVAAVWPQAPQRPPAQRPSATPGSAGRVLPALELVDDRGEAVPLRSLLPAVIIVVDGCTCTEQVAKVAGAAPAALTVAAVTSARTTPRPVGVPAVRALADPASELRELLPDARAGSAQALLVSDNGEIVRTLADLDDPDLYRGDLAALAGR